jgi:Fe-S cluster assembly ATPase SufC
MGLTKIKEDLEEKIRVFIQKLSEEGTETKEAVKILQKHIMGESVTPEEEKQLKEQFFDVLKMAGIGIPFILIPGASLLLPAILYVAKKHDFNLFPSAFNDKEKEMKTIVLNNNTNYLGVSVTKPNNKLYILRGISGSGKSTKAKELVGNGVIHSTDDVITEHYDYDEFFRLINTENKFYLLGNMHSKNLNNFKKSIDDGKNPIIVDNTNLKASDIKPYVKYALEMGFSDENVNIIEIGTGGLTAEELANRNTHGVQIKKIEDMIKKLNGGGKMTLKKIMDAKEASNVIYSAVVLDNKSHDLLLNTFSNLIPDGWKKIAHHMTITLGELKDKTDIDKDVTLTVTHVGLSDKAMAVVVTGYRSKNKIPHVTIAINPNDGKAKDSNDITNFKEVKPFEIVGKITEIKK